MAADTVPSFICLAADDDVVPPLPNGITLFRAAAGGQGAVTTQMFRRQAATASACIGRKDKPCAAWPELFLAWAATHGFKA